MIDRQCPCYTYIKKSLFRVCSFDACDKPKDQVGDGRGADVLEDVRHELFFLEELKNLETGKLVAVPILYSDDFLCRKKGKIKIIMRNCLQKLSRHLRIPTQEPEMKKETISRSLKMTYYRLYSNNNLKQTYLSKYCNVKYHPKDVIIQATCYWAGLV